MLTLSRYSPENKAQWDAVIADADNSHFMFYRDYMDYHADRFTDHSFIICKDEGGEVIGALPGNADGKRWHSHQGLTFGGIFMKNKYNRTEHYRAVAQALQTQLREGGFKHMSYKFMPHIYHKAPCEADMFALQVFDMSTLYREVTTAVDLRTSTKPSQLRKRGMKKAIKAGLNIQESDDLNGFWAVLSQRLEEKYARKPVHTIEEMARLQAAFPDNIRLFTVTAPDHGICAGTVMFETDMCAHAQYIAADPVGQKYGALDVLFLTLIERYRDAGLCYFDFGISTEDKGARLNEPLAQFKEGFGGRPVIHYSALMEV